MWLPLHVSQPRNSLQADRQLGQSQGSFHLFPLKDHCPSLAGIQCLENTPSKWKLHPNLFHVLSLFSCFRWKDNSSTSSCWMKAEVFMCKLTTWIIMPGSSICIPLSRIWATFYLCYPVDTPLEMSLKYTLLSILCQPSLSRLFHPHFTANSLWKDLPGSI